MKLKSRALAGLATIALVAGACGPGGATATPTTAPTGAAPSPGESTGAASPSPSLDTTPVTIKVWDYYGESTPVKPALDGFKQKYPWITVDYQALDWDSMNEKFTDGAGGR